MKYHKIVVISLKYLLVQISEPAKGKSRQLEAAIEARDVIADAALSAFDWANQGNVANIVGTVLKPSAIPQSIPNTGNSG